MERFLVPPGQVEGDVEEELEFSTGRPFGRPLPLIQEDEEEEELIESPSESLRPSNKKDNPPSGVKTRAKASKLAKANLEPESSPSVLMDSGSESGNDDTPLRETMDPDNNQKADHQSNQQGEQSGVKDNSGTSRDPTLPDPIPASETAEEIALRIQTENAMARQRKNEQELEKMRTKRIESDRKRANALDTHERFKGYFRNFTTNAVATMSADEDQEWRRWWIEKRVPIHPDGGERLNHRMVHIPSRRVGKHVFKVDTQFPEGDYGLLGTILELLDAMKDYISVYCPEEDYRQARESYLNFGRMVTFSLGLGMHWDKVQETMSIPIDIDDKAIMEAESPSFDDAKKRRESWFTDDTDRQVHCMGRPVSGPTLREKRANEERFREIERQEAINRNQERNPRGHPYRGGTPDRPPPREHSVFMGNRNNKGVWGDKTGPSIYGPRVSQDENDSPDKHQRRRQEGRYQAPHERRRREGHGGPPRHPYQPNAYSDEYWTSDGRGWESRQARQEGADRKGALPSREDDSNASVTSRGSRDLPDNPQPSEESYPPEQGEGIPPGFHGTGTYYKHPEHGFVEILASERSRGPTLPGPATLNDTPNVLVTALTLPTNIDFIHPTDSSWKKIITYLKEALNQRVSIRADQWNPQTLICMNTYWKMSAPEEYFGVDGILTDWRDIKLEVLIKWMEDQQNKELQSFDRTSKVTRLQTAFVEHPLSIDFADASQRQNDNTATRNSCQLLHRLQAFKDVDHEELTQTEEMQLCKDAYSFMKIKGLAPGTLHTLLSDIRRRSCQPGTNVLKDIELFIDTAVKCIGDKLAQRQLAQQDFPLVMQSAKGSSSSSSSKQGSSSRSSSASSTKRDRSVTNRDSRATKKSKPSVCKGCGYNLSKDKNTDEYVCRRKDASDQPRGCAQDPRRNKENVEWEKSSVGKQWKAKGYDFIPKRASLTLANAEDNRKYHSNKKGIAIHSLHADNILQPELIPFRLSQAERRDAKRSREAVAPPPEGKLLLDTGALGSNVMSNEYAKKLRRHKDCYSSHPAKHSITTAAKNNLTSNTIMKVKVNLVNERTEIPNKELEIDAVVAPIAVDLIV